MNFLQLLKDSLKTDGNVSNMRMLATITVITCLAAYCAMVVTMVVQVFAKGSTFAPVDLPVVLAGTIVGVLGVKAGQAVFGEKEQPQPPKG